MIDPAEAFTEAFLAEVDERKQRTTYPPEQWNAGGRSSKAWPNKEDTTWWLTEGPHMVEKWAAWWAERKDEGWLVWTTPAGKPAVEVEFTVSIGGIPVRGFIDVIVQDADDDLWAIDWKSGREPTAPMQLGVYALALEKLGWPRPQYGAYYLARKADIGHVYDLSLYTDELVGPWLQHSKRMQDERLFIPHPSTLCGSCSVRDFCAVMGGTRTDEVPNF